MQGGLAVEKKKVLKITCVVLIIAICATFLWSYFYKKNLKEQAYDDGIVQIDVNTLFLTESGIQVDFYDVIVGKHEQVRKLIVGTQEATVSVKLTDRLIEILDVDFLKKTQKVSYTGTGYFVVDLDDLDRNDILVDKQKKTVTIRINHAHLQAIEIDPEKIMIDEVKEGLLAWGDIKLTVSDFNAIEKDLQNRMEAELETTKNVQKADDAALRMVKELYEPVVKAVNGEYEVRVEFK